MPSQLGGLSVPQGAWPLGRPGRKGVPGWGPELRSIHECGWRASCTHSHEHTLFPHQGGGEDPWGLWNKGRKMRKRETPVITEGALSRVQLDGYAESKLQRGL